MNKLKDQLKSLIVAEALKLFLEKSIREVTISDIAKRVEVGEATMYRYFKNKQNIVMAAAIKLASNVFERAFKGDENKNGYEKIKGFYMFYLFVFKNNNTYFSFVRDLDAYILTEAKQKVEYEYEIDLFKQKFLEAYDEGIKDNSLRNINNIELYYYTTTHSLLNLCKTLSFNQALVSQDEIINKADEVKMLINIFLNNIKK